MRDRRVYRLAPGGSGVAAGRLYRTDRPVAAVAAAEGDAAVRAEEAFGTVAADLAALAADLTAQGEHEAAAITTVTVHIAQDPELRAMVDAAVAGGATAEVAVAEAIEHFAGVLAALPDATLAERAADVRAVGRRLLAALGGRATPPGGPLVLAAHEITADDLLTAAGVVVGAASVIGGATSHAAIVARSLGVPLGFGADPDLLAEADGTEVLLDLSAGTLIAQPDAGERAVAQAAAAAARDRRERLVAERNTPVTTLDGQVVEVLANVAGAADADIAVRMAAPGVGLLRTEMPFLTAQRWPTVDDHRAALAPVLDRLAGRPVTVRTLDFADDKLPPFLAAGGPLGRSLPLMLADPQALAAQVRALMQSGGADLRIMIPMVASADEMRQCRDLVARIAAEEGRPSPPVGAMIELPEAVAGIDAIAAAADFLSLGTNDLSASMLGRGRRDPSLTPASVRERPVLAAVAATVAAGERNGRRVSVCGDAASDPVAIEALIGVGCRVFSVAPSMVDEVRAVVRSLDARACAAVAASILAGVSVSRAG